MRFTDTDAASSCILWILLASRPYIVLIKQLPELADIIVQFEHFYLAPFLNPFWRHSFQIELYNWWWMCTENNTNTTASAWIGLRENVGRINITTVYSSSSACHRVDNSSRKDLPRKECQLSLHRPRNIFPPEWPDKIAAVFFWFWIWIEGLPIGWI